jgi:DNA-binding MarR family transcriptional regulator
MHANRLAMARMAAQHGAHHGEVVALALLSQREDLTQKELAETLHLSPPRVSIIVDSLEKSGAVERLSDKSDRRVVRLRVTPQGRKREKSQRDLLGEYVNRTLGALPEADRRQLARLLGDLADKTMALVQEGSGASYVSTTGSED